MLYMGIMRCHRGLLEIFYRTHEQKGFWKKISGGGLPPPESPAGNPSPPPAADPAAIPCGNMALHAAFIPAVYIVSRENVQKGLFLGRRRQSPPVIIPAGLTRVLSYMG